MTSDSLLFKLLVQYAIRTSHPGQWRVLGHLRGLFGADVDEDLKVVRAGLSWILNPADAAHASIFWEGEKDHWDLYHLRRLLNPDSVVYDIGANIGFYSVYLASVLGPDCDVHSFEPFPDTHDHLCKHIALNGLEDRITAHRIGFSDQPGTASMYFREGNTGSANLNRSGNVGGVEVALRTLDDFWADQSKPAIDFIKIDVEGHEARLLNGGAEVLRSTQPLVLIELDEPRLIEGDSSLEDVVDVLNDLGYALYRAERSRLVPITEPPRELTNAFAFPRSDDRPRGAKA